MRRLVNALVALLALWSMALAGMAACSSGEVCFYSSANGGGNE